MFSIINKKLISYCKEIIYINYTKGMITTHNTHEH